MGEGWRQRRQQWKAQKEDWIARRTQQRNFTWEFLLEVTEHKRVHNAGKKEEKSGMKNDDDALSQHERESSIEWKIDLIVKYREH